MGSRGQRTLADMTQAGKLLLGKEKSVDGDVGYIGAANEREELSATLNTQISENSCAFPHP